MLYPSIPTRLIGAVVSILILGSCGDGAGEMTSGTPAHLVLVSGGGQTGVVGDPLVERLEVRVLDDAGLPVSGATVSWELESEEGSLERASSNTDSDGMAENAWRLGPRAGEQLGRAWLAGAPPLEFTATAVPGASVTANISPGQHAFLVHEARTFESILFDRHGNPLDPVEVPLTWTVGDPGVASVNDRGVVRAVGPGTTQVEVSTGEVAVAAEIEVVRLSPKPGTRTVSGVASLPRGADPSAAYVTTLLGGAAPVEADAFRAEVAANAATVILLMEAGRIQGMAVVPAPAAGSTLGESMVEIDAQSTAASLLYLSPPFGLAPPEISEELLDVIHSLAETEVLARVIAARTDSEGRLPGSADQGYTEALFEAYGALVAVLRAGRSGEGVSGSAEGDAVIPTHSGLEFSEPRVHRSGWQPVAEFTVRNHALRWVSLHRRPVSEDDDPAESAKANRWVVIPAAAPCIAKTGSATDWFNRCWTGEAIADPTDFQPLQLTFAPDRPKKVLSAYGPGSASEGSTLPPGASEILQLPTFITYAEHVLGSVTAPLAGARGNRMLAAGTNGEGMEGADELVRWLEDRANALPSVRRCLRAVDGAIDGLCVKERLFQDAGDEGWRILAEVQRRLVPALAAQFTDEELRWLGWRENLVSLMDRTVGVLAQMPPKTDRPLLQAVKEPVRAEFHLGYNELIGATAITLADEGGQAERALYPGESLLEWPAVRVTNQDGHPVVGAWVTWEPDGETGSLGGFEQRVTETDAEGVAQVDWTLVEGEEPQFLKARLAGYEPSVEFRATVFQWGQVTTSGTHNCGVGMGGKAYCWGTGSGGTLGTGLEQDEPGPSVVMGDLRFSQLSAAPEHTCGLTEDGAVYCWGVGRLGRLGTGSEEPTATPAPVLSDVHSFEQITANHAHTCGLASNGRAYCWGRGEHGQLGTGSWGGDYHETVPTPVESRLQFSQLAAGSAHTCALARDGRAYCWGWPVWGRLGTGSTQNEAAPAPVATDLTFAQLVSGSAHTCALTEEGEAFCWGYGWEGQLGTGSSGSGYEESAPVAVTGDLSFVQLAAGSYHTCGLTQEGDTYCWGSGPSLGAGSPGDRAVPTAVRADHRFVELSAGLRRTCGVTVEGAAHCWGPEVSPVAVEPGEVGRFEPVRVEPPGGG